MFLIYIHACMYIACFNLQRLPINAACRVECTHHFKVIMVGDEGKCTDYIYSVCMHVYILAAIQAFMSHYIYISCSCRENHNAQPIFHLLSIQANTYK